MDCSTPGFPVYHQLAELAQTRVHQVSDAIQPSHPQLSPSPPAFNLSQHQCLFQWVSSSHQVAQSMKQKHIFLEFSCFFYDPTDVGNLISGSSAFSKSSLNILKFSVHILLKSSLENFQHYLLACEMSELCGSLNILWHCLSLRLEWKLTFSNPVATAEFSKFADILSTTLSQHHLLGFEIAQLELHHLH